MSLRARLTLTLFVLAVVPLAGTIVYSYVSSRRAYETAVASEAASLAAEMPGRMASLTDDLSSRISKLEDVPFGSLRNTLPAKPAPGEVADALRKIDVELGPVADLIESLEFTPTARAAPVPGSAPLPPPPAPPAVATAGETARLLLAMRPQLPPPAPGADDKQRWMLRTIWSAAEGEAFRREIAEAVKGAEKHALALAAEAERLATEKRALAVAAEAQSRAARVEARHPSAPPRAERDRPDAARTERPPLKLRREFSCTTKKGGAPSGHLKAHIRAKKMLLRVLAGPHRDPNEVPFAIDTQGVWHSSGAGSARLAEIAALVKDAAPAAGASQLAAGDWVIAMQRDAGSGLTWGVARPIDAALREIRATAARNFLLGFAVVGLALAGVVPLSRRLTRDLAVLAEGATKLGQGDFTARVPVRSRDEIGRLGETFNHMAAALRVHQEQVVEQERLRRELELCRRIQEEMLPHAPLHFSFAEAQGLSIPAREVGGDFFNYFALPGGEAALLVGDVSGKGVPAALLMANVQATLRARLPLTRDLAQLATELDREIEEATPRPTYLTLFAGILNGERRQMRYVNAGQNPPILVRPSGESVRLDPTGRPLALLSGGSYEERAVTIGDGDALVLYTDGLVESENAAGEPFGIERLERVLAEARESSPGAIVARIDEAVRAHRAGTEPDDDATVVVLRAGPAVA